MTGKQDRKKIYDETASVIMNLYLKRKINSEETNFLLNLLELVMVKKEQPQLISLLKEWRKQEPDEEIDAIIRETLLQMDLNQPASLKVNLEIIQDLVHVSKGTGSPG